MRRLPVLFAALSTAALAVCTTASTASAMIPAGAGVSGSHANARATVAGAPARVLGTTASWDGKGTYVLDSTRYLDTSLCDIVNGAPVDGNYLKFKLAAVKGVSSPTLTFGSDAPLTMDKSNQNGQGVGSYSVIYVPTGYPVDLQAILDAGVVANWTGDAKPVLTLGEGCVSTDPGE